jgi:hypothetical protein
MTTKPDKEAITLYSLAIITGLALGVAMGWWL